MPTKKSTKRHAAFTAMLFEGNVFEDRVGGVTDQLSDRFGVRVLAAASFDTEGRGGGEGSAREEYGGLEAEDAARLAASDLYEMASHDIPPAKRSNGCIPESSMEASAPSHVGVTSPVSSPSSA